MWWAIIPSCFWPMASAWRLPIKHPAASRSPVGRSGRLSGLRDSSPDSTICRMCWIYASQRLKADIALLPDVVMFIEQATPLDRSEERRVGKKGRGEHGEG